MAPLRGSQLPFSSCATLSAAYAGKLCDMAGVRHAGDRSFLRGRMGCRAVWQDGMKRRRSVGGCHDGTARPCGLQ